jgi:hypothetical protein
MCFSFREGVALLLRRPQLALEVVVEFHDPEPLAFPSSLLPRLILSGGTNGGNCTGKILMKSSRFEWRSITVTSLFRDGALHANGTPGSGRQKRRRKRQRVGPNKRLRVVKLDDDLERQRWTAQQQIHALESVWQARQHEQIGQMKSTSSGGICSS